MTRTPILSVSVSAINMAQALATIDSWVQARSPHYVCVAPAHSVMECVNHPELLTYFNSSGLTTPDGMPIVWLLRARGFKHVERVYGPDLMQAICAHGLERGYRHYFYGGAEGIPERLAQRLQERFPGLQVVGTYSPPFRALTPEEDEAAVRRIQAARPDVVWVGISSPKQEAWMYAHVEQLGVPALIGVGAAFDFLSGAKRQAPRWIQRSGFEWLFRLACEPRRLWKRYIQYPRFAALAMIDLIRYKFRG